MSNFEFEKVEGGYSLVKYTGDEANIVVPDRYEGEPVVALGINVFRNTKIPVNIVLPDTLKKIGGHCFERCENLKEIIIPDSVIELGSDLFLNCSSLEKVTLPRDLEILPSSCFGQCSALEFCVLPDKLKSIGVFCFLCCVNLQEIVIPSSINEIGSQAFAHCDALKRVKCTGTDFKINKGAFYMLDGKESQLEEFPYYIWGKVDLTTEQNTLLMKSLINSFPSFGESEKKDYISFLKRRKKMKEQLFFHGDSEIVSFLLSLGLKLNLDELDRYLEESIKQEKTEVTALFLEYKNKNFRKTEVESYSENKELVEIGLELPTLKQFKTKWKCKKVDGGICVTEYIGSETNETIPVELADGTKIVALQKIISGKEKPIPTGSLKHLTIEAPITSLTQNAFHASELESIILPDTMETIGNFAFTYCEKLKNIVFPPNLKILPDAVCGACYSLEEVTLPENLEEIGAHAFLNCRQLKIVHFPNHQVDVGESAFAGNPSLHEVTLPLGVKLGEKAFDSSAKINWK
ncbi:MAG: leucine-rich repeat domain-containing protein [Eubacteriales bacterium]